MQKPDISTVYIASDHGGEDLRFEVDQYLREKGYTVEDLTEENTPDDDYPDFAERVAKHVAKDPNSRGILMCTSGIGISIAANKYKNIRASQITNPNDSYFSRKDNNLNIISLPGKKLPPIVNGKPLYEGAVEVTPLHEVRDIIDIFLETHFDSGGRHERRVNKIDQILK